MLKYYQYCPDCLHESVEVTDKEIQRNRIGTDGWGQPVKFTNCKCGGKNNGFLYLSYYTKHGEKINDELLQYLKHRIEFYL